MNQEAIIDQTRCWVETVVIGCGFCPFAKREMDNGRVRFVVSREKEIENCLLTVIDECQFLDSHDEIETILIIFPDAFANFDEYLSLVELAEQLLDKQGYEGIYQLASFHPDYCFANSDEGYEDVSNDVSGNLDAANYTNRSPYPMLHLLREGSLEKALSSHQDPDGIPRRNIEFARTEGIDAMKARLDDCCQKKSK